MFLGYQNDLIAVAAKTKEEVENSVGIKFTKIEETQEPVEMVCGTYYIGNENIQKAKEKDVREYRNYLLQKEVDPIVSNPLRWNDMSEYDKTQYQEYRTYLLDWTENEEWWNEKPKTFEDYNTVDLDLSGSNLGFEPGDVDEE